MENNLPGSWARTSLGYIADWGSGGTPKSTEPKYYDGDIPWLIIGDLNDGPVTTSQKRITKLGLDNSSAKIVSVDSVLCAMYGSIGKLGIAKIHCATNRAIAFTQHIYGDIPYKFLYYYLFSLKQYLLDIGKGGTQANISQTVLKEVPFPLPPLPEQHRIVAKLDALFEKIESNKKRLERIPVILKRFRQSVLAAAVSGKLTEEWREENSAVTSAEIQLEKLILKRKRQQPNVKLDLSPVENHRADLPPKWVWTRLVNISEVIGGVTKGRRFNGLKTVMLPYLRVANVQDGYLNLSEIKTIESLPEDLGKYRLRKGDILFTEGGDRDKLGRGTLWNDEVDGCIHQNHIFRARVDMDFIIPEYISFYTKSAAARDYFSESASQTVNLASINLTMLGKVPIALPPIEEQREIVKGMSQLYAIADKIEAQYAEARAIIDKMPQSILARAFWGELVPQDPDDEPASALLERIRSQKATKAPRVRAKTSGDKKRGGP